MKNHFRCAALVLLATSGVLAYFNKIEALFLASVSLEIYSLTEWEKDWTHRFEKKGALREVLAKSYPTSVTGAISGYLALILLALYLTNPLWS